MSFRVAILGSRGVGFFHARIFHELGHQVCGVLGSSDHTALLGSLELNKQFGINAKPFSNLDDLIHKINPDVISVCTPAEIHFNHLIKILNEKIPVFCEKPLFWSKNITYHESMKMIKHLRNFSKSILHVNTSNASFIKAIKPRLSSKGLIRSFNFKFHTNGVHRGKEIAPDLLPHGISMLLELFGPCEIKDIKKKVLENSFSCEFIYGECSVNFEFIVGKKIKKKLLFSVDDHQFLRVQENLGSINYHVGLKDSKYGDVIKVEDPFKVYIKGFLSACKKENDSSENIKIKDMDIENIKMMMNIIFK